MKNHHPRVREIFEKNYHGLVRKIDRLFGILLLVEWVMAIAFALVFSPSSWAGDVGQVHIHVYAAIFFGGIIALYPAYLTLKNPGRPLNRYIVAIAQMIFSILFIHLTGGRIETHFHVFGSLAFIATYRDRRVLILASGITLLDHLVRGLIWPESVYGVMVASPFRALEHGAWVCFEDFFLLYSIKEGLTELRLLSEKHFELEKALAQVEEKVAERTKELQESQETVLEQQQALLSGAKLSALGEMASGIAHEINNPLAVIQIRAEQVQEELQQGAVDPVFIKDSLHIIHKTADRIGKIVRGLKTFSREGSQDPFKGTNLKSIVEETLIFCKQRFDHYSVKLKITGIEEAPIVECRATEISQVLLNLLNNSFDAIADLPEKWIEVEIVDGGTHAEIRVTDSGGGIPAEIRNRIMQPFFTTKGVGKGTGLGLSISRGIVQAHKGNFYVDAGCKNTRFVIVLPKKQMEGENVGPPI